MADDDQPPLILFDDRQTRPLDVQGLVALARATLEGEGSPDVELSVSFVTEAEMAELHERYLGEPGSTDVLSFPQDDDAPGDEPPLLGDVVICPEVAERDRPDDPAAEVRLLLVHGILHLLGHDHQAEPDRAEMWARQERYMGVRP